jgi:ubiquinone/menaquinone biosynthesis C-methylase UbiE
MKAEGFEDPLPSWLYFCEGRVMESRKEFFDRHASSWDHRLRYAEKQQQLREVISWFGVKKGEIVLDIGTGTGVLLSYLKEAVGTQGRVAAMDFSLDMLKQAKMREFPEDKTLINAGVTAIPFQSGRFDRVTCFCAFPHFPDKEKALDEMVRVLKKDGYLFIAHLHSVEEINSLHEATGGAVTRDRLPDPENLRTMMHNSGLQEISIISQPGKFLAEGRKV